jgi:hypothetical protein
MPQGTAFSVLGHDCGGIKEYAYVTGFDNSLDPAAGYPTGYVQLSTRCGSRGPGTTYTAWTADTWDLTGALLSYSVYSGTPSVDPGFSATDPRTGNQISNSASPCPGTGGTGSTAYACLQWASTFTPRPRVTAITPVIGPATGGASVTIYGDGFTAATGVEFGGTPAAGFTVNSDNSITAVSPADTSGTNPHTVDLTVVSPGGTSFKSSKDQFTSYIRPTITGVSPNHGGIYGGYYVTVSGTNFIGTTAVMAGDTATGWQVISNTAMSVYIPASDSGAGDSISISITSPGGTSPNTPADTFTYTAPAADYTLTVEGGGAGDGRVTSSPAGIDCPNNDTCAYSFASGTQVALTATAFAGSFFEGWSGGGCHGSGTTCVVTLNSDTLVTAGFELNVSGRPTKCDVPKLKGRTLAWAKREIRLSLCRVGTITKVESSRRNLGRVLWQRPRPDMLLRKGSKVALEVGK